MKLQKSTLILIALALGLSGTVYFLEIKGATERETAQNKQQKIFNFTPQDIQAVTVRTEKETIQLQRVNTGDKTAKSEWKITLPVIEFANKASVIFLLDKITTSKFDRNLTITAAQLTEFGLDKPTNTVEIKLNNQQTHKLTLGKPDFTGNFIYAQIDPPSKPTTETNTILLPIEFKNALNRPLSEWKYEEEKPTESDKSTPKPETKPK